MYSISPKALYLSSLIIGIIVISITEAAIKKHPVFEGNGTVADKYGHDSVDR